MRASNEKARRANAGLNVQTISNEKPVSTTSDEIERARLRYLTRRVHALGPAPLAHFFAEIEAGANLREHLEEYAALPADFIKAYGGDVILPAVHLVRGWRP